MKKSLSGSKMAICFPILPNEDKAPGPLTHLLLGSCLLPLLLSADQTVPIPPIVQPEVRNDLALSGQYRGRFESYDGVNKVAYGDEAIDAKGNPRGRSDDTIYLQQIIAGIDYIPNRQWRYKFSLYDARSWGSSLDADDFVKNSGTADEYRMSYYDDHLELFETYARRHNLFGDRLTLTIGRQQLGYGDRRIFGPGKWGNTMGWLWDAAHLSYKAEKNFLDIWYGQTRIKEPNDFSIKHKHRYQGVGLYARYETERLKFEPFFAWRNNLYHDVKPEEKLYYGGARLHDDSGRLFYDLTAVVENGSSGDLDARAYAYAIKAGYRFNMRYSPALYAGLVYASGDKDPADAKMQTFTTPFGANDGSHYGRMDIMIWSNMQDIKAGCSLRPTTKLSVEAAYHHFTLAEANDKWYTFGYQNLPGNQYTHIGDEYDLSVKYRLSASVDLLGIYGYLNAGDFIKGNGIAQNDASKSFLQFLCRF